MLLVKAWVGESKIHGLGVIAHEFIPEGTVTWRLVSGFDVLISLEELKNLPTTVQDQVQYYGFFHPDYEKHIFCVDDDRFTNHSDNANQRFCGDYSVAIRDIHPGEELTDNYNEFGRALHTEVLRPLSKIVMT
ncbi:MAG: SET domain-containing protein [Leptospira sp.]|nr:SET domain-containing protein [Leptospira sp.]